MSFAVRELAGLARKRAPADFAFSLPNAPEGLDARQLRIARLERDALLEVPAQFYALKEEDGALVGRAAFFVDLPAGATRDFRLYYGNLAATDPGYPSGLSVKKGPAGPQHYLIENECFKVETMPKSGQIWHVWDKLGSNTSWHHNEWIQNTERGGDPCHWAPNTWVAYPERVTFGHEVREDRDPDVMDWHYVFGWEDPNSSTIAGPIFFELRRWGPVWPHPEHSNPEIKRDGTVRVRAEVVYRFYDGLPWFRQASRLETQEDLKVFFIRNSQFAFLARAFTHAIIAPERTGVYPTDRVTPAVIHLMARENLKPFPRIQHDLSNVLPPKVEYLGYYNRENGDGFIEFQLLERNTNIHSGAPTYRNHCTILTELHDWSVAFSRNFSYTNLRFHAENATFLPKGERYEEDNVCLIYRHESLPATLAYLERQNAELRHPAAVEMREGH